MDRWFQKMNIASKLTENLVGPPIIPNNCDGGPSGNCSAAIDTTNGVFMTKE
jgi:hypothetical protein